MMRFPPLPIHHRPASAGRGFTMMEVLVAIGIFGIGIIAVAAIFPTAIAVQRETVDDAISHDLTTAAEAVLFASARPGAIDYSHDPSRSGFLEPYVNGTNGQEFEKVQSLIEFPGIGQTAVESANPANEPTGREPIFTLVEYGTDIPAGLVELSFPTHEPVVEYRTYFAYPMVMPTEPPSANSLMTARFFVMMMKRGTNQRVPQIRTVLAEEDTSNSFRILFRSTSGFDNDANGNGVMDLIKAGDWVLADDGRVHRVILADEQGITVDSVNVGQPERLFFGVAIDQAGNIIPEVRSPVIRITEVAMFVPDPTP